MHNISEYSKNKNILRDINTKMHSNRSGDKFFHICETKCYHIELGDYVKDEQGTSMASTSFCFHVPSKAAVAGWSNLLHPFSLLLSLCAPPSFSENDPSCKCQTEISRALVDLPCQCIILTKKVSSLQQGNFT